MSITNAFVRNGVLPVNPSNLDDYIKQSLTSTISDYPLLLKQTLNHFRTLAMSRHTVDSVTSQLPDLMAPLGSITVIDEAQLSMVVHQLLLQGRESNSYSSWHRKIQPWTQFFVACCGLSVDGYPFDLVADHYQTCLVAIAVASEIKSTNLSLAGFPSTPIVPSTNTTPSEPITTPALSSLTRDDLTSLVDAMVLARLNTPVPPSLVAASAADTLDHIDPHLHQDVLTLPAQLLHFDFQPILRQVFNTDGRCIFGFKEPSELATAVKTYVAPRSLPLSFLHAEKFNPLTMPRRAIEFYHVCKDVVTSVGGYSNALVVIQACIAGDAPFRSGYNAFLGHPAMLAVPARKKYAWLMSELSRYFSSTKFVASAKEHYFQLAPKPREKASAFLHRVLHAFKMSRLGDIAPSLLTQELVGFFLARIGSQNSQQLSRLDLLPYATTDFATFTAKLHEKDFELIIEARVITTVGEDPVFHVMVTVRNVTSKRTHVDTCSPATCHECATFLETYIDQQQELRRLKQLGKVIFCTRCLTFDDHTAPTCPAVMPVWFNDRCSACGDSTRRCAPGKRCRTVNPTTWQCLRCGQVGHDCAICPNGIQAKSTPPSPRRRLNSDQPS